MSRLVSHAWAALVAAVAVSIVMSGVFFLAGYWAAGVPAERVLPTLRQAFASGALQDDDFPQLDRERGFDQYDECLVYMMLVVRPRSRLQLAVSPIVIFGDWPVPLGPDDTSATQCGVLRTLVSTPTPPDYSASYFAYHRYLHGHRVLAAALLPHMTVAAMRSVLRATCYGVLLACIAIALGRAGVACRTRRHRDAAAWERPLCFAAMGCAFLFFYGLEFFAMSIAHAPADIVLFAVMLVSVTVDLLQLTPAAFYALVSVFGCLVAYFEFFIGSLPLALAVLPGILAIQASRPEDRHELVVRAGLGAGVILGSFVACFLIKLAVASVVAPDPVWGAFFDKLAVRMGDASYSLPGVARHVLARTYQIAGGSLRLGLTLVAFSGLLLVAMSILVFRRPDNALLELRVTVLLASLLVVLGWMVIFRNHTWIHAAWMVRLLTWPIAVSWILAVIAIAASVRRARPDASA